MNSPFIFYSPEEKNMLHLKIEKKMISLPERTAKCSCPSNLNVFFFFLFKQKHFHVPFSL